VTAERGRELALDGSVAAATLLYLSQLRPWLPPPVLTWVGAAIKLTCLGVAAFMSLRASSSFEPGTLTRRAWRLLGLGFAGFFLGQLCLTPYQLTVGSAPFPSVGDVFFVLAYPFFIASLFVFVRAHEEAGYPLGTPAGRRLTALGVAAAALVVAFPVLKPILEAPASPMATFLNLAYPSLDLVLLVPTALLIRITLPFRSGGVGKVWVALLGGFLALCAADIGFAYFSALGQQALDPLLNAMFVLAYGLMARGVMRQRRLVA
jgi:hypothetical protein